MPRHVSIAAVCLLGLVLLILSTGGSEGPRPAEAAHEAPPEARAGLGEASPAPESDEDPLDLLAELADRPAVELDLVSRAGLLPLLKEVRGIMETVRVPAPRLRARTGTFPTGDVRRLILVLATAWAEDADGSGETWLLELAGRWDLQSNDGEQEALAAVLALDLGGRRAALEQLVGYLLERHRGEASGEESFPGMTRVRTWFAIRGLERFEGPDPVLEAWITDVAGEQRVAQELWALAVRSDPEVWGPRALASARSGELAGLAGVELLCDADRVEELGELALEPGESASELWRACSAWRALVATDDERARALVVERLAEARPIEREMILEALKTWRASPGPETSLASLLVLRTLLEQDQEAVARLDAGLEEHWLHWFVRRDAEAVARMKSVLEALGAVLTPGSGSAPILDRWFEELR